MSPRRIAAGAAIILGVSVIPFWRHAVQRAPSAAALYYAGQRALIRHDLTAAAADFRQASQFTKDPDKRAWSQYQFAACFEAQPSKRSEAIAALQALIQDEPHHFLAARAQADLDRLQGRATPTLTPPPLDADCGPEALAYLLQHSFNRPASISTLRLLAGTSSQGTTLFGLQKAAQAPGLKAVGMKVDLNYLRRMRPPAILWVRRSHFIAFLGTKPAFQPPFWKVRVYDPAGTKEETLSPSELETMWDGYLLKLSVPAEGKTP